MYHHNKYFWTCHEGLYSPYLTLFWTWVFLLLAALCILYFPWGNCGSAGKESGCNMGDLGLIPGLWRSLEKGMATHSSILAWRITWTVVHGVAKSQTWLRGHFWGNILLWEYFQMENLRIKKYFHFPTILFSGWKIFLQIFCET